MPGSPPDFHLFDSAHIDLKLLKGCQWRLAALAALPQGQALEEILMRTAIFAVIVIAGSAVALPAMAQQKPGPQEAAPSEHTTKQMQDADKEPKTTTGQANEQMQRDADKGVKTRNSGESGYVGDQDKPGAAAHPPGTPK
jgi:hypothetical protein